MFILKYNILRTPIYLFLKHQWFEIKYYLKLLAPFLIKFNNELNN